MVRKEPRDIIDQMDTYSSWPKDIRQQFRLIIRNYSKASGLPLNEAISLIMPAFIRALHSKKIVS